MAIGGSGNVSGLQRQPSVQFDESLRSPLLERSDSESDLRGVHEVSERSPLVGHRVSIRSSPPDQDIGVQRQQSQERVQNLHFGKKLLNGLATLIALPFKLAGAVVATTGGLLLGGLGMLANKATECCFGISDAKRIREHTRDTLGQPVEGGVMSQEVTFKDGGGALTGDVADMMEAYRARLGGDKRISQDMMVKYINMGERIVAALNEQDDYRPGQALQVDGHTIKPNLETTRAISWYLQAKAMVDNSGVGTELAQLVSGSMVAKDPGNKLHAFLSSAPNAYGRVSSHFEERSASVDKGWLGGLKGLFNGGFFAGAGVGLSGQPLQRGIEDFGNKMPSGGGTLLFDKLRGKDGEPEILLKWEPVGTPTTFSFTGTHADDADGFAQKMWNRGKAAFRNIEHTLHFAGNEDPVGYRGEKVTKGEARAVFRAFEELVNGADLDRGVRKQLLSAAKSNGIDAMKEGLERLPDGAAKNRVADMIDRFEERHGADLGIARKGGEVHVMLTTPLTVDSSRTRTLLTEDSF